MQREVTRRVSVRNGPFGPFQRYTAFRTLVSMRKLGVVVAAGAVLFTAACGSDDGGRTAVRSEGGDPVGFVASVDDTSTPTVVDESTTTSVVESGGTTSIVTSPPTTAAAVTTTSTVASTSATTLGVVTPTTGSTPTTTAPGQPVTTTTAVERAEVPALTVGIPWEARQGGPANPNQCDEKIIGEAVALALDVPAADEELRGKGLKLGQVRFRGYTGKAVDNPPSRDIERARELIAHCASNHGGQFEGIILTTVPDHPGSRAFAELVKRQVDDADLRNMKNPVTIR